MMISSPTLERSVKLRLSISVASSPDAGVFWVHLPQPVEAHEVRQPKDTGNQRHTKGSSGKDVQIEYLASS